MSTKINAKKLNMQTWIDYHECLRDSPKFRTFLEEAENDVDILENRLEKLVKLCNTMTDAGKAYGQANRNFVLGVRDLAATFTKDDFLQNILVKCTNVLEEIETYHTILLDQAHRSVSRNLNSFIKEDVYKLKEQRKQFEKTTNDFDTATLRSSQVSKSRPDECKEAARCMLSMASVFGSSALDYIFQFCDLHNKKRSTILDSVLSYMGAQNTFFHQGSDMFSDLDPYLKEVNVQLEDVRKKSEADLEQMKLQTDDVKSRKDLASQPVGLSARKEDIDVNNHEGKSLSGYLFKRTTKSLHKSWVRRWFAISHNKLSYRKRSKDTWTVMEDDLRLCLAKPLTDIDRRFCFEIISPRGTHTLQADTEEECFLWISCIIDGSNRAYNNDKVTDPVGPQPVPESDRSSVLIQSTSASHLLTTTTTAPADTKEMAMTKSTSAPVFNANRIRQFQDIPGNEKCCDCGTPDPRWASINLGITLCIECSGIHRSLGVHVSKVRSLTLDAWEPEVLKIMAELGNTLVNGIYEACVDESLAKRASPNCARIIRENWIKMKYMQRAFVKPLCPSGGDSRAIKWTVHRIQSLKPPDTSPDEASAKMVASGSEVMVFGSEVSKVIKEPHRALLEAEAGEDAQLKKGEGDNVSLTFVEELTTLNPDQLLYKATQARNLSVMLYALALGADPNNQHEDADGKTPLIVAVETGSLAPVEFLLLNRAKVDVKDHKARSPLHHASLMGNTGHVCQFIKRHANQHAVDLEGQTPLSIAVDRQNADIVTLLRIAKLNEEMRESEGYMGQQDETFNEVFKDFSHMASHTPEKLNRKK